MDEQPTELCPFIEQAYPACDERFSMESISEAFSLCAGQYVRCPIYHELRRRRNPSRAPAALAAV